jgi:hypothetical protein
VIGRDRDLPVLERLGSVKVLAQGPNVRFDRTYLLFQVTSALKQAGPQPGLALSPYVLHRRANVGCEYGTADLW